MARKKHVDYIKAIGITLVILGHINYANDVIKEWIYAFHMPLFYFATGVVIKRENIDYNYFIKKFQGLIVPYFIWGFIYAGCSFGSAVRIGYGSYHSISRAGSLTSLWFLPTMFIGVVLCQLVFKASQKVWIIAIMAVGAIGVSVSAPKIDIGYPWCADVSLLAAGFILFGHLFERIANKIMNTRGWVLLCIIGVALTFTYRLNSITANSYVLMANMRIGNPIVFLISAFGGCLMVYSVSRILEWLPVDKRLLSFVGTNTLVIFAVQKPIIHVFGKCFEVISMYWLIELIVAGVGTLTCACVLSFLIDRFAPCLAGRSATAYTKLSTREKGH